MKTLTKGILSFTAAVVAYGYLLGAHYTGEFNPINLPKEVKKQHEQDIREGINSYLFEPQWRADLNGDGIWSFEEQEQIYRIATGTNNLGVKGKGSLDYQIMNLPTANLQRIAEDIHTKAIN